jgi:tetratricopeptide (TPR) repeat protein
VSSTTHLRDRHVSGVGAPARTIWINRPWLDLLIGCGGWSAPLLLISYLLVDDQARQWSAVFYALALVCNYPHYMATIHRAYGRADDRSRYKLFTHYITAALVVAGVAAHFQLGLLAWLFTTYVTWSPWHYTGQNFGLSMMFLRRAGVDVTPRDRRWLHVAFVASYVMLLAAFNEGPSQDPLTISAALPVNVSRAIQGAAALVFVGAGVMTFRALAGRGARLMSLLPSMTLYVTQALWFVVPILVAWSSSAAAPQTRYSTGILAVMHSAQYLWITHHFARKDAAAAATATGAAQTAAGARGWSGWAYWTTLVAGGVALFIPGPWLASYAGQFDFSSSMLIVTAVVNIHHFILDGVVWKLRDPRVSKVLTTTPPSSPSQPIEASADARATTSAGARAAAPAGARAAAPAAARTAASADARAAASGAAPVDEISAHARRSRWPMIARVAAVILLIALAGVDQWRYVLALGGGGDGVAREALERASVLNPFDSTVHLRLASAARLSGDEAAMERELRRAVAVDSHSPAPYHALERFFIESGRWQEAYDHGQLLIARWPREVDTLVNLGVLAQKLNDPSASERWWRRALDVDESQRQVHLYLAELLDGSGRTGESLPHYQRYLELVARATQDDPSSASRASAQRTALVVIKFGDALTRANQPELAASQYDLAERIARQTGLADIASLAREHRMSPSPSPSASSPPTAPRAR